MRPIWRLVLIQNRALTGYGKTTTEGMVEGGKIRKDGKITTVPLAHYVRTIDFGDGKKCYERSVGRCIYSVLYNGYSKH